MIFDILEKWKSSCPGKISESCWTDVQIYDLISFFYLRTCRWSGESLRTYRQEVWLHFFKVQDL